MFLYSILGLFSIFISYFIWLFSRGIKYTKTLQNAIDPFRRQDGSVGYDLYAPENFIIKALETVVVNTGISIEIPFYIEGRILEKSSKASTTTFHVRAGVIDPNYRGNICVVLWNHHPQKSFEIKAGTAIAQIVFRVAFIPKLKFSSFIDTNTKRGLRGFGGKIK